MWEVRKHAVQPAANLLLSPSDSIIDAIMHETRMWSLSPRIQVVHTSKTSKVEYPLLVRRCRRRLRLKQEAQMDPEEALVDSRNRLQSVLFGGTTASVWIADGVLTTRQGEEFLLESVVDGRLVSVRITSFIGPFMTSLRALLERTAAEDTCTGRCPLVTES